MSTDAHRPASSRITDALLPPEEPTGRAGENAPTAAPDTAASRPAVPPRPTHPPTDTRPPSAPASTPRPATAPHTAPDAAGARRVVPPRPASAPRQGPDPVVGPAGAPPRPATAPRAPGDVPAVETTTRLRPIREATPGTTASGAAIAPVPCPAPAPGAPITPGPRTAPGTAPRTAPMTPPATGAAAVAPPPRAQTYGTYGAYRAFTAPPETPVETTTRLRPIRERRVGRVVAAGACLVLGVGLVGGALAGAVLAATDAGAPAEPVGYTEAATLWHSVPVDTLFPRTLAGPGKGPGAADRTWTRVVVAPDTPCTAAALPASVLTTLRPLGCDRVLRATYTDATASSVITVGLVFTQADPTTTRTLATRSAAALAADVPPALAGPGTVAARFGPAQRASWSTHALTDLPVVVTAVSGFADGRAVAAPESAARAMAERQTSPAAQAGLGHEAKGVADQIERALRASVATAAKDADT